MEQSREELVKANHQLEQRLQALDAKLSAAREQLIRTEKLLTVGRLASGVGHDLNNMLSLIIGHTGLLLKKVWIRGGFKLDLQKVHESAIDAAHIVENFLTIARPNRRATAPIDLNYTLTDCIGLLAYELRIAEIEPILEIGPDLPQVMGDPQQIRYAFLSIIQNACLSMAKQEVRGQVRIRAERDRAFVKVSVSDQRLVTSPSELQKLFESPVISRQAELEASLRRRKPTASTVMPPLFSASNIIREHGGKIYALNAENDDGTKGVTIVVELPIASEQTIRGGAENESIWSSVEQPEPKDIVGPRDNGTRVERGKTPNGVGRILVVDDEPFVADMLQEILEREGYQVDTTNDVASALECVRSAEYDLIICDVHMPGLSGADLHHIIRESFPHLAKRFIFVTGNDLASRQSGVLDHSDAPCLGKPFDIDELKKVVRSAIGGTRGGCDDGDE